MEALAAVGLAAAVVQFVDFSSDLVTTATDAYRSQTGTTDEQANLTEVYSNLERLCSQLDPGGDTATSTISRTDAGDTDTDELKTLAVGCRADCEALLNALQKILGQAGRRNFWKSSKAAIHMVLGERKRSELEARIGRTRSVMALHISANMSRQLRRLEASLQTLTDLSAEQRRKRESVWLEVKVLANQVDRLSSQSSQLVESLLVLGQQLTPLLAAREYMAKEHSILSSLRFSSRRVRHTNIPEAHVRTFRWVFDGELSDWLRQGSGVFWVTGKAGSGKSTLMKLVADHHTTRTAVRAWALPASPILASHYFWNPGTEMQRSLPGLLRNLLSEIFHRCPSMIPTCCPGRWDNHDQDSEDTPPWTTAELLAALEAVAGQSQSPAKFCFFIDGLDEYDGDHLDLCSTVCHLARSPHIKVCVSSRPWNVFQDSFGTVAAGRLTLHEHTSNDIKAYVADRLQSHPRWDASYVHTGTIDDVVARAQGVFLWVILVIKSLRDGLTNDDSAYDLQRRLESLPTDLESLFRNILNAVDPTYNAKMAGMMFVALEAAQPLRLEIYYHNDQCYEKEDYFKTIPFKPLRMNEIARAREQTRRQINARSGGLLEVHSNDAFPASHVVEFLHRTVRDFLKTAEMVAYLSSMLQLQRATSFYPPLAIFRAFTAWIKTTQYSLGFEIDPNEREGKSNGPGLHIHVTQALHYCREAYLLAPEDVLSAFSELDNVVRKMLGARPDTKPGSVLYFPGVSLKKDSDPVLERRLNVHRTALAAGDASEVAALHEKESQEPEVDDEAAAIWDNDSAEMEWQLSEDDENEDFFSEEDEMEESPEESDPDRN